MHRLIREQERLACDRVALEERDPLGDARPRLVRLLHELVPRLLERLPVEQVIPLPFEPARVRRGQRRQRASESLAVELGEVRHAEQEAVDLPVLDLGHFMARELGRDEGADHAVRVGLRALDARVVPDGPLLPVAEEQREHARIVLARRVLAAPVRAPEEAAPVVERQPHLEDERSVALVLHHSALVDDPEAQHARAVAEPFHRGRAQLAHDAQPRRIANAAAVRELLRLECHGKANRPAGDALPAGLLLVLRVLCDLDGNVVRVGELHVQGVRAGVRAS